MDFKRGVKCNCIVDGDPKPARILAEKVHLRIPGRRLTGIKVTIFRRDMACHYNHGKIRLDFIKNRFPTYPMAVS